MLIKRYSLLILKWVRESVYSHIILTMLASTIIGIVITSDFGISTDEPANITYGLESLKSYYLEPVWQNTSPAGPTGPFAFMLTEITTRVFAFLNPAWILSDGRHFTYFLMFQISTISIFGICLRFTNRRAALLTSILFLTQPLIFGHAFINPKDIPFMAFFTVTILAGLVMTDAQINKLNTKLRENQGLEEHRRWEKPSQAWMSLNAKQKASLLVMATFSTLIVFEILVLHRLILPQFLSLVYSAYHNTAVEPINSLFQLIAERSGQIDVVSYLWKVTRIYWFLRGPLATIIFFLMSIVLCRKLRTTLRSLTSWKHLIVILASIPLGLATSIRIVAPFAGLLVSIYLLAKCGLKGLKSLTIYWGFAIVIAFITRPFFWDHPLERIWNSLRSSSNFNFEGVFFFQGEIYSARNLPSFYSPTLIFSQLTEPLLLLLILGILVVVWKMIKGKMDRIKLALVAGWYLVPIVLVRVTKVTPYDNFRQFLFIIPPLFIIASVGIDYLLGMVRNKIVFSAIILAILFPGILGIFHLHPYEYIYYNSLAGDISRADRNLELDYWCTSHRAAMDYINEVAPDGSIISVSLPINNAKPFAREDLILVGLEKEQVAAGTDYVLMCTRYVSENRFVQFETEWEIRRYSVPLSVVKRVD